MKLRTLTASLALAAGLGIAPASQALDLGNLAVCGTTRTAWAIWHNAERLFYCLHDEDFS